MSRIAVFVDGNNIFFMCLKERYSVDYKKLLEFLKKKYGESPTIRRFYTAVPEEPGEPQKEFIRRVEAIGYTPIQRVLREHGNRTRKGNMDATIGFDMRHYAGEYDILVLLSGDGDFARNISILVREKGKRFLIVSSRESLSSELLQLQKNNRENVEISYLEDIIGEVGREKRSN